jgi:hypothetical protein
MSAVNISSHRSCGSPGTGCIFIVSPTHGRFFFHTESLSPPGHAVSASVQRPKIKETFSTSLLPKLFHHSPEPNSVTCSCRQYISPKRRGKKRISLHALGTRKTLIWTAVCFTCGVRHFRLQIKLLSKFSWCFLVIFHKIQSKGS